MTSFMDDPFLQYHLVGQKSYWCNKGLFMSKKKDLTHYLRGHLITIKKLSFWSFNSSKSILFLTQSSNHIQIRVFEFETTYLKIVQQFLLTQIICTDEPTHYLKLHLQVIEKQTNFVSCKLVSEGKENRYNSYETHITLLRTSILYIAYRRLYYFVTCKYRIT